MEDTGAWGLLQPGEGLLRERVYCLIEGQILES